MNKVLFVFLTVVIGVFTQLILDHYFSFYGVAPQILLLITVALGFIAGPSMGETVGFICGFFSDVTGSALFGQHMLMLTLAGFTAGMLQKRIASERPTAQLVIAFFSTCYFAVGTAFIDMIFESGVMRVSLFPILISMIFNMALVIGIFWILEHWLFFWRIQPEIS